MGLTLASGPWYQIREIIGVPLPPTMSPCAFLLRCLLIVALCFDVGVAQWRASAMAVSEAQQAADATQTAALGEDCETDTRQAGEPGSDHDCDCDLGSRCCGCAFPAAVIVYSVPFSAQHLLATRPLAPSVVPMRLPERTRVFRPPIG